MFLWVRQGEAAGPQIPSWLESTLFSDNRYKTKKLNPCCRHTSLLIRVMPFTEMSFKCCCVAAAAWYYKILENLVSQEKKRLGVSVISVSVLPSCGHIFNCWHWVWFPQLALDTQCCCNHVFVPGNPGCRSDPVLSGGLLSGDQHMLKTSTMWFPSAPSDLKRGTIPLLEGAFHSL